MPPSCHRLPLSLAAISEHGNKEDEPYNSTLPGSLVLVCIGAVRLWASGQPFLGLPAAGRGT